VDIPASVISIVSYAFYGCSGLANITLGDEVTKIGARAFEGCTHVATLIIPEGVTQIGSSVFDGWVGAIYFKGNAPFFENINPDWPLVYYCAGRIGWDSYSSPKSIWTSVAAFYAAGGTALFTSRTYDVGNAYGTLPTATRTNYAFGGWWTQKNGLGSRVYSNTMVPYLMTAHSLYATWTLQPAIGAEDEVLFMTDSASFGLPYGYSGCIVEVATAVTNHSWNFAPLDASEYAVSNGIVYLYFSTHRPMAIYRAKFSP